MPVEQLDGAPPLLFRLAVEAEVVGRRRLRVEVDETDPEGTKASVDALMGTKPEARFRFIQERAEFTDAEVLDI